MTDSKTAHIVETPQYFFFIRIAQFILSIVILGLVGYTIDYYGGGRRTYGLEELGFMVFCCVWTWLVIAYVFITTLWLPVAYNMWGQLAAEVLATLFWFCAWAATAAWVADLAPAYDGAPAKLKKPWSTAAAGTGLGALIWVLFMITTVTFCLRLNRHRKDPANAHLSKLGLQMNEKHELGHVAGAPVAPAQQPQVYQAPEVVHQQQYVPTPSQTPVQYPGVQPTPPPQGWSQSPPPQQQPYAQV